MIAKTPFEGAKALVKKGVPREHTRALTRQLRIAQAQGILQGLCAALGPDDLCIDCGAHHGDVTLPLADTGAQVIAFEPDPENFAVLQASCEGLFNVSLRQQAVAETAGPLQLFRPKGMERRAEQAARSLTTQPDNKLVDASAQGYRVEGIDFVSFLRTQISMHGRVSFLKIDVEGAEVPILEALLETDLLTHVNLTVVETHRWLFPDWGARYAKLAEIAQERPEFNLYLNWI